MTAPPFAARHLPAFAWADGVLTTQACPRRTATPKRTAVCRAPLGLFGRTARDPRCANHGVPVASFAHLRGPSLGGVQPVLHGNDRGDMLGSSGALNVTAAVDKGSLSGNMNLTFDPSQGTIRSGTSVSATLEGLGPALWGTAR